MRVVVVALAVACATAVLGAQTPRHRPAIPRATRPPAARTAQYPPFVRGVVTSLHSGDSYIIEDTWSAGGSIKEAFVMVRPETIMRWSDGRRATMGDLIQGRSVAVWTCGRAFDTDPITVYASRIVISVDTTKVQRPNPVRYRGCTLDARNGIRILVLDSLTGERLTLRAIALGRRKGAKVDTGGFRVYRGDNLPERIDDRQWIPMARELPGVYDIEVRVAGYRPWFARRVVVNSDGCHVILVSLTARLVRDTGAGHEQSRAASPWEATYARVVRDAELFDLGRADSAYATVAETLWLHRDGTYQLRRMERAVDSAALAHRREIGITGRYAVLRTVWPPAESERELYATHRLYFRGASANFSADEGAGFASLADAGWLDALDEGAELTGGGPDPPASPHIGRLPAPRVYRRVDQRDPR